MPAGSLLHKIEYRQNREPVMAIHLIRSDLTGFLPDIWFGYGNRIRWQRVSCLHGSWSVVLRFDSFYCCVPETLLKTNRDRYNPVPPRCQTQLTTLMRKCGYSRINLLEGVSKKGFWFQIAAGPSFKPVEWQDPPVDNLHEGDYL